MISQQRHGNSRHYLQHKTKDPVTPQEQEPMPRSRGLRTAERWVGEHPVLCVGMALIAGVSLGWLVKRK